MGLVATHAPRRPLGPLCGARCSRCRCSPSRGDRSQPFSPFGFPGHAGSRPRVLVSADVRRAARHRALCRAGLLQRHRPPHVTLRVTLVVAITNALLNQLFIFGFGLGVAGSAWATGAAQLVGLATAFAWFFSPASRRRYRSHLTSRFAPAPLLRQMSLGFPMGLLLAADILGFALFQLMQVRLGNVDGASTQIVLMLTSFCYMPAVGIAMAGTTLVGQAIGAGTPDWARTAGNGIILLAVVYMGIVGVALAAIGPWVLPWFTNLADAQGVQVVTEGAVLLWIAAGYQLFDGLNISSGACLRGAGDVRLPSLMVLGLSWSLFVPLAHALSFKPGAGWVGWLPQYGLGALGGWLAALIYICCLGTMLFLRWHSGAWRRVVLR